MNNKKRIEIIDKTTDRIYDQISCRISYFLFCFVFLCCDFFHYNSKVTEFFTHKLKYEIDAFDHRLQFVTAY